MKIIKVIIKAIGTAIVTTGEVHSENENKASKIVLDFTEVAEAYPDWNKWVDIIVDGEVDIYSMRYDLGTDIIVEKELEYENTLAGHMTITPFLYDGVSKIKFKSNRKIDIIKNLEAGNLAAVQRDDYIFSLAAFQDQFEFYTETEFDSVVREVNKIYGVYSESTGVITWYYGIIGV
jgi:hypothetical protein